MPLLYAFIPSFLPLLLKLHDAELLEQRNLVSAYYKFNFNELGFIFICSRIFIDSDKMDRIQYQDLNLFLQGEEC
jgi:hypothetical protein